MTSQELAVLISAAAGFLLSLAFAYVPKLKDWYSSLDSTSRAFVMMISLLLVSIGVFASTCLGMFNLALSCEKNGIETLLVAFFAALASNQPTYNLLVKPFKKSPLQKEVEQTWDNQK